MRKNKKVIIFILILMISIGFALISTSLSMVSHTKFIGGTFNVAFNENGISKNSESNVDINVVDVTADTITFDATDLIPGKKLVFDAEVINNGTMDAMLRNFYVSGLDGLENNIIYSVYYSDGVTPAMGHTLKSGKTEKFTVTIEYLENLLAESIDGEFNFIVQYETADKTATRRPLNCTEPVSFTTDSWETIVCNVQNGNTNLYNVGAEKILDMGDYGTQRVRIANKSTPSECGESSFSQSACGFVVEFVDFIEDRVQMSTSFYNYGGWPSSNLKLHLDDDVLPQMDSVVREAIIDTYTVSGHGSSETDNFSSNDKLYLLSTSEIYPYDYDADSAYNNTRILDYYNPGADEFDFDILIKYNGSDGWIWWTRTPNKKDDREWIISSASGGSFVGDGTREAGLAPAFRIG